MTRNVALIFLISLALPIVVACGSSVAALSPATILPENCSLTIKQELSLTLDGFVPPQAIVRWIVDQGEISFVVTSAEAVFIAPSEPAVVTISALVTPTLPGMKTPITRQCVVTSLNTAPSGLAKGFEVFFGNWLELPDNSLGLNAY